MFNKYFNNRIKYEINKWLNNKIINPETADKLLSLYKDRSERSGSSVSKKIPAILIGFAIVLLSVGIILFYAANWKAMAQWVKLAQVFLLMIIVYGLSFYFLSKKEMSRLLGRGFLVLGMVTFGAGIMLVAQIFHISAHPSNGVFVWALGALIMSAVMKERFGYYLSAVLFGIWNLWEVTTYSLPNFSFILFLIALAVLFYQVKDRYGIVAVFIFFVIYFFQITNHWFEAAELKNKFILLNLLQLPFGLLILSLTSLFVDDYLLRPVLRAAYIFSMIFIFTSLIATSWNVEMSVLFPIMGFHIVPLSILYIFFTVASGAIIILLKRMDKNFFLPGCFFILSLIIFFLPLGNKITLMIVTHISIVSLIFLVIYDANLFKKSTFKKVVAFVFACSLIAVKGIGMLVMSGMDSKYRVAYGIGAVIFITVCFLINLVINNMMKNKNIRFSGNVINSVTAFIGFWILYFLSFKLPSEQESIFSADLIVIIMLGLFILLALVLYLYLWKNEKERIPVFISASVFFTSLLVLVISGPWLNKDIHTIIFNILLFVMIGAVIYYAVHVDSIMLANMAIVGFIIHILTRYFDIFWDMLSGSIFIIITGIVLLLVGGVLEKSRRKIIHQIEEHSPEEKRS